ncbi:hypothetical protein [Bradyrhizobium sp. McL0616]|uniref:hypothetical protein n=1 Tax=Bradyrhizobium sp. McL0616 TaxID=3415674 RepID=UPI003CF28239
MRRFISLLAGTYGNWATTTLAAVLGTAAMSPITAANQAAPAWQELLVTSGFVSVGVLMLASTGLVLWGFVSEVRRERGEGIGLSASLVGISKRNLPEHSAVEVM